MEDVVEGVFKPLGSVIRWLFWNLLFEMVFFSLGRAVLLLITLGHYPKGDKLKKDETYISIAGIGVVAVIWLFIALYNNF